jgi:DNA polymerase-4
MVRTGSNAPLYRLAAMQTWIMHVDMDAFYASIEQRDHPELKGRPVIVGGGERGVVAASSYEARRFGVRSAMPMFRARRLCPRGVFVPVRMERYREVSRSIMAVLSSFSPLVEQASVDEAYLDATGLERLFGLPRNLWAAVKAAVCEASGLTCSVGLAPVKFLAKIASDMGKPDGLTVLQPDEVPAFLAALVVEKFPGIGEKTLALLESMAVRNGGDVLRYPEDFWVRRLGKAGAVLYNRARGIDEREVIPFTAPKSESAENTFDADTLDRGELEIRLFRQAERVGTSLRRQNLAGRTITLKVKYADFCMLTRSMTLSEPTDSTSRIYESAVALLTALNPTRKLRLIGIAVSRFGWGCAARQCSLWPEKDESRREERNKALDAALDTLRDRFGEDAVVRGKVFPKK